MTRTGGSRSPRTALLSAVGVVALCCAACVPTTPGPSVSPQPLDSGIVEGSSVAPSRGCPATPKAQRASETIEIETGSGVRRALLRMAPDGDGPSPLLISLHPFTQGPATWENYSGLAAAAVARGYVVVSPTGSEPGPRWAVPGGLDTGVDDIDFIAQLVLEVESRFCIDRNREFAAGYSAGAAMAQALSCTMPWRFAAVAGSGGVNLTETCPDSPPTDVLILHGTKDPVAPPAGSQIIFAPPLDLPVATVAATNASRANCDPDPTETTPASGVSALVYTGCGEGRRVELWNMVGAGHTWAGATPFPFDLFVGPTAGGFSATEEVLDFFDAAQRLS